MPASGHGLPSINVKFIKMVLRTSDMKCVLLLTLSRQGRLRASVPRAGFGIHAYQAARQDEEATKKGNKLKSIVLVTITKLRSLPLGNAAVEPAHRTGSDGAGAGAESGCRRRSWHADRQTLIVFASRSKRNSM